MAGVVEDHARLISDASLELKLALPGAGPPVFVNADRLRLAQALSNLVGNAIKFTPKGGTLTVGVFPDLSAGKVVLSVADTGIGIDANDAERLFRPFVQGEATLRYRGGLGLGLALARALVAAAARAGARSSRSGCRSWRARSRAPRARHARSGIPAGGAS